MLVILGMAIAVSLCAASATATDLRHAISGLRVLSGINENNPDADTDSNGKVELQDVILSLQIVAGLRSDVATIVLLIPTDIDKIKIAWLPVSSSSTSAANMSYQIHLSKDATFTPSESTRKATVKGQAQADVSGLELGTTYYVLIVADDGNGNRSRSRTGTVKTFSNPVIVNSAAQFSKDSDLGLQNTAQNGTIYSFANTTGATPPQPGSILFTKVGENIMMRKVTSVNTSSASIDVKTEDAALSEVLSQGTVNTKLTLFDTNQASQQSTVLTQRSVRSDGSRQTVMRWKDDLLTAEHTDNAGITDDTSVYPGSGDNEYNIRVRRDGEEVQVKAIVAFTPELSTDISWVSGPSGITTITNAETKAKGTINVEFDASYKFSAGKSFEKEVDFPLFKRTYKSRYLLGGIWVWQDVTYTLKAVISANASTLVETNYDAKASAALEFGTRYDPASGQWIAIPLSTSFEKSFIITANAQGNVSGRIRLIPNIEVKFYEVAVGNLSVEPITDAAIGAELIEKADLVGSWGYSKMQFTKMDMYLQAEAYVSASLDIFIKKIILLDKTNVYTSPQWYLFSLPKLSLASSQSTVSVNEAVTLTATVADGANNPFNDSTIKWQVYPSGKGTLTPKGRTATFVPSAEETYTIFFSGYGALGEVGRQFASSSISVSDPSSLSCTYYCGMTDYYTGSCIGYSETCYINGFVRLYRRTYYPSGNIMEEMLFEKGDPTIVRRWNKDGTFSELAIYHYDPGYVDHWYEGGNFCGLKTYSYQKEEGSLGNIVTSLGPCAGSVDRNCFDDACKLVCTTSCPIPDPPTVSKGPLPPANKSLWQGWQ